MLNSLHQDKLCVCVLFVCFVFNYQCTLQMSLSIRLYRQKARVSMHVVHSATRVHWKCPCQYALTDAKLEWLCVCCVFSHQGTLETSLPRRPYRQKVWMAVCMLCIQLPGYNRNVPANTFLQTESLNGCVCTVYSATWVQ